MNVEVLRRLVEQVLEEQEQVNEAARHQTDKTFRPITSAVTSLFSSNADLRELSTEALDKVLEIIYEDLKT